MNRLFTGVVVILSCVFTCYAQNTDTIKTKTLKEVEVKGNKPIVKNEGAKSIISISGTP